MFTHHFLFFFWGGPWSISLKQGLAHASSHHCPVALLCLSPRWVWSWLCCGCQLKGRREGPTTRPPEMFLCAYSLLVAVLRGGLLCPQEQPSRSVSYSFPLCQGLPARHLSVLKVPWRIKCGSWMWLRLITAYKVLLKWSKNIIGVVFIRDLTLGEWNVSGRKKFGVLQLSADQILCLLYFTGKTFFCKGTLRKIRRNILGCSTVKPTAFVDMLILVTISKKHREWVWDSPSVTYMDTSVIFGKISVEFKWKLGKSELVCSADLIFLLRLQMVNISAANHLQIVVNQAEFQAGSIYSLSVSQIM